MCERTARINPLVSVLAIAVMLCCAGLVAAQQTTAFTYQGKLTDAGNPASGAYQLQFKLFDVNGTQIGATVSDVAVTATAGVFTTNLDVGAAAFPGADRFLEIAVRHNAGEGYTILNPRQQISSSPYSIRTLSAAQADDAQKLGGVTANQYVQTNDARLTDARQPAAGSANYIQNTTTTQAGNFNVSGNGVVGGSLTANGAAGIPPGISYGVYGSKSGGYGVYATGDTAVAGVATNNTGVYGEGPINGVYGLSNGSIGVAGKSNSGTGVKGDSVNGRGVLGVSTSNIGVSGESTSGEGVRGFTSSGAGVEGDAGDRGSIALRANGTSWFHGDTSPLNNTFGTGILIGASGSLGYIQAYDYSSGAKILALNNSGGNVGINTLTPDQTLSVNGNASKVGAGSWLNFSDERLKNIKGRFTTGLSAVMQLQPIRYQYKPNNALKLHANGEEYVGFGAQAVQRLIPEAVTKDSNGYLLVNNDPIMWTMLNAIKEQQAQIEALRSQNSALNARLRGVEKSLRKRVGSARRRR